MELNAKGFKTVVAWMDTETGGLDKDKCAILSLAIIITNNMKEVARKEFRFRPSNYDIVEDGALKVNGFTRQQINTFPTFEAEIKKMQLFLDKYINLCINQENKFYIGGQNNIDFDTPFIMKWLKRKASVLSFTDYFHLNGQIDTKVISKAYGGAIWPKERPYNNKLTTMSEFYGLDTDLAHTAIDDTARTIQIYCLMAQDYSNNKK
jgi:DNA polymerase-3 subunit epsilon